KNNIFMICMYVYNTLILKKLINKIILDGFEVGDRGGDTLPIPTCLDPILDQTRVFPSHLRRGHASNFVIPTKKSAIFEIFKK
ncbi:MAG: hypothetical protein Q8754_03040, partial [Sweet potato little leaf phytoplasma]|nr:hypothetical protein [Sweet potato little leaf phytoplasma]